MQYKYLHHSLLSGQNIIWALNHADQDEVAAFHPTQGQLVKNQRSKRIVCYRFLLFSRGNWDSLIGSAGEKTPDQTASELEQQRNVLVFLFPSLAMEVRAALGFVEIPPCIVRRQRKWFKV